MNLIGRSWRVFFGVLMKREKLNKLMAPQSFSGFAVPRIFASQKFSGDADVHDFDHAICRRSTNETLSNCLRDVFECTQDEIISILEKCPSLTNTHRDNVVSNARLLKDNGLSKNSLIIHPWVLEYNSQLFPKAIELLKVFHRDLNVILPFLAVPYKKLLYMAESCELNNDVRKKSKIEWMSELLECDEQRLSEILKKHYYILGMPEDRILYIFNILKEGGVSLESIVKDICIFKHNSVVMKRRLAEARDRGVSSLKPWSLRCSETTFQRTIERKAKAREFLGDHKSVKDYLATRLQCDEETLKYIFYTIPQLKHISVLKVKDLLDFLYEVGYSPEEVCQVPRILTRSVKTIEARVVQLESLGLFHPNLLVLCKTTKEYQDLIGKLKHKK